MSVSLERAHRKLKARYLRTKTELAGLCAGYGDQAKMIAELRELIEKSYYWLGKCSDLYAIGFNELNARESPSRIDKTGISEEQWKSQAETILAGINGCRADIREHAALGND